MRSRPIEEHIRSIVPGSGVSRAGLKGGSKSRKFKWLVKVGACKDVNPQIKKIMAGGGFPGNQKTPLDTPLPGTEMAGPRRREGGKSTAEGWV